MSLKKLINKCYCRTQTDFKDKRKANNLKRKLNFNDKNSVPGTTLYHLAFTPSITQCISFTSNSKNSLCQNPSVVLYPIFNYRREIPLHKIVLIKYKNVGN